MLQADVHSTGEENLKVGTQNEEQNSFYSKSCKSIWNMSKINGSVIVYYSPFTKFDKNK